MKKAILIFLLCVIFLSCNTIDKENNNIQHDEKKVVQDVSVERIWEEYGKVISESSPEKPYRIAYDEIMIRYNAGELGLSEINEYKNSILTSAGLEVNWESGTAEILLDKYLIERYFDYKNLIYAMLTHEIWHAYCFFTDRGGFESTIYDELENIMYEMDAYHAEAMYFEDFPSSNNISRFEKLLLDCYKKDKFYEFTSVLEAIDLRVIHSLYLIRDGFFQGIYGEEKVIEDIIDLGSAIEEFYIEEKDGEFEKYLKYISISTYNEYSGILLNQVIKNYKTFDEIYVDYPQLLELYEKYSDIINKDLDFLNKYIRKFWRFYEI